MKYIRPAFVLEQRFNVELVVRIFGCSVSQKVEYDIFCAIQTGPFFVQPSKFEALL